jgi:hypothetical protein
MHPYRVKEYMWVVLLSLFIVVALLSGCSSAPTVQARKPQYCHTSQTIKTQNGERVNSETTIECTDDQIKKLFQARSGMASNCGEFTYWMTIGGSHVQRKGVSCQKLDGSWEVVNTTGM